MCGNMLFEIVIVEILATKERFHMQSLLGARLGLCSQTVACLSSVREVLSCSLYKDRHRTKLIKALISVTVFSINFAILN